MRSNRDLIKRFDNMFTKFHSVVPSKSYMYKIYKNGSRI
jgi:hypothetical protein